MKSPFTALVVVMGPAGAVQTVDKEAFFFRSFFVNLELIREPEAPPSSGHLTATGFGFPELVLNLTKVIGLMSLSG